MKKIIIILIYSITCTQFSIAQTIKDFKTKDIDAILSIYYTQLLLDSAKDCQSTYYLLPEIITVEYWEAMDTLVQPFELKTSAMEYNPAKFYSKLKIKNRVLNYAERCSLETYLGNSFLIEHSPRVENIKITPTDSTAYRYHEVLKNMDIKYRLDFNKAHGIIFDLRPAWIFVSNYSTSHIIFEHNFTKASVRINLATWSRFGYAYFKKKGKKWVLDQVEVLGMSW